MMHGAYNVKFQSFCGATDHFGHKPLPFEVSRSHTIRHTLVAEAATCSTQQTGFPTVTAAVKRPQTYALVRSATETVIMCH